MIGSERSYIQNCVLNSWLPEIQTEESIYVWVRWWFLKLTNWIPVSLRIPIPAEAKLAPTSSFWPVSAGLRYGNVVSAPRLWPDIIHKQNYNTRKIFPFFLKLFAVCFKRLYLNKADSIENVWATNESNLYSRLITFVKQIRTDFAKV